MTLPIGWPRTGSRGLGLALVLAAGMIAACANPGEDQVPSDTTTPGEPKKAGDPPPSLTDRLWTLNRAESEPTIDGDDRVTIRFEPGRASGQAPCNSYNGDVTFDDDQVELGPIASTKRACDPATDSAEAIYLEALAGVGRVATPGPDRMILAGNDGVELAFDAQTLDTELVGTWEIVNLVDGDALSTPLAGTTPTITFADDGRLNANAGCNQIGGGWQLDGASITISDTQQTLMACDDPEGVMKQESALAEALDRADRVEVADQLTIFDADDAMLIVADRASGG